LPPRLQIVLVVDKEPDDLLWRLAAQLGAEHVAVLPASEPWLIDRIEKTGHPTVPARVIGVLGGRGGAGASVFAAGLAVTAARQGAQVLLVDADPLGGGVDLILGWEELCGLRWPELANGELGDLPARGKLSVLSQDRREPADVTPELMDTALRRGQTASDLVVIDLPRSLDPPARRALQYVDLLLLIVPAELRACAAAAKMVLHVGSLPAPMEAIVRSPAPGQLKAAEIARAVGLPLAGTLRSEPDLATALERGAPPAHDGQGPLAELCRQLLADRKFGPHQRLR
jgi:secretion/DNA translocation related CpaE-like protein